MFFMSNYVISVEGVPGSGKSALLAEMAKFEHVRGKRVVTVFEEENHSLKNYFSHQEDYCTLANLLFIMVSRVMTLNRLMKMHKDCIFITERSAEADLMFATMLFSNNKLSTFEYEVYQLIHDMIAPLRANAEGRIVLRCETSVATGRFKDTEINQDMFNELSDYQDDYFRGPTPQFSVTTTESETIDYVDDAFLFIDAMVRKSESDRLTYAFLLWSIFLVTVSVVVVHM
jgi:deoxyadenosine/deoxycytidine kinase